MPEDLESLMDALRAELDATDEARERALVFSRAHIRCCASAIRMVHRGEMESAEAAIREGGDSLSEFRRTLDEQPSLVMAPFVMDAEKEQVEAWVTLCLAAGRDLPTPADLHCPAAAYLNGLAEGVMEIRRHVVDLIRQGETQRAEAILDRMDDAYAMLVQFDYPDAILLGLKRRLDTVRGVIEKTRYDITTAIRQGHLERAMRQLEGRIAEVPPENPT